VLSHHGDGDMSRRHSGNHPRGHRSI